MIYKKKVTITEDDNKCLIEFQECDKTACIKITDNKIEIEAEKIILN
jgi:hypothetical protein